MSFVLTSLVCLRILRCLASFAVILTKHSVWHALAYVSFFSHALQVAFIFWFLLWFVHLLFMFSVCPCHFVVLWLRAVFGALVVPVFCLPVSIVVVWLRVFFKVTLLDALHVHILHFVFLCSNVF